MHDRRHTRGHAFWKRGAAVAVAGGLAFAVSGCDARPVTLKVVAQDHLTDGNPARLFSFDQDKYVVPSGELDVVLAYPGPGNIPHTLEIRNNEGVLDLDVGGSATRADQESGVVLEPGVYELYCDIVNPTSGVGHADVGMTAQLIVL